MSFGCFDDVTCLQPSVLMGCSTYGRRISEMNERVWLWFILNLRLIEISK